MTRGRGRFCSKECLGASKRNGSLVNCANCGEDFYRRFGEQDLLVRINQFCSRPCFDRFRALERSANVYVKVAGRHEHRWVAEMWLGRALLPDEVVHHVDEDKHNNDPANLCVFPDQSHHARWHKGSMSDDELRRFSLIEGAAH